MMNYSKLASKFTIVALLLFTVMSCDDNEEIVPDPDPGIEYDAELDVSSDGGTPVEEVTVNANTQSTITVLVSFTSSGDPMKRLYITQNISGQGEEPYEPTESIDLKGDGSVDLESESGNEFDFEFDLPVPSGVDNGTVIYKFWATSGKGDFRDESKRLVAGPGYIELTYGTGDNPEAELVYYENVQLDAPLEDGTSNTFVSLLDGQTYKISEGSEYAAYWDFGYWYGLSNMASLSSTADYPSFIDIEGISGVSSDELNNAYFQMSSFTSADFDDASMHSDLESVTNSGDETINNLDEGDIVEFVDNYGNKGLLRVDEINGTNGSDGYIVIDIKVQR